MKTMTVRTESAYNHNRQPLGLWSQQKMNMIPKIEPRTNEITTTQSSVYESERKDKPQQEGFELNRSDSMIPQTRNPKP